MKTKIALVLTAREAGRRTYTAVAKGGQRLAAWSVIDAGQGAAAAERAALAAGYVPSFAEWALALHRSLSV